MKNLTKKVFGYHLGNVPETIPTYRFDLLSTVGYAGYIVNGDTGSYKGLEGWLETDLVAKAAASDTKVVLIAQLLDAAGNNALFASTARQDKLIRSLLDTVKAKKGGGVQIDFEEFPAAHRDDFTAFMKKIAAAFRAEIPGSEISAALPAINGHHFDLAAVTNVCDYVVLMGYDYAWSKAPNAGAVAPLGGGGINVTTSVNAYLTANVPPEKLLLGVPFYGFDWPTATTDKHAKTTGQGKAYGYEHNVTKATAAGRHYDATAQAPWYAYTAADGPHVAWYDDEQSLKAKYDLIKAKGLGGMGCWALYWADGAPAMWNAIEAAFT